MMDNDKISRVIPSVEGEEVNLAREKVKRLDVQRRALESEAEAIIMELTTPPPPPTTTTTTTNGNVDLVAPMGLDTPLVDAEGFPRADIDVYRARHLRNRLAIIRTDHKNLMKQMEQGLHHFSFSNQLNENNKQTNDEQTKRQAIKPKPKFDPRTGKWVVKNWDGTVAGIENGETRSFDNLDKEPQQKLQHQEETTPIMPTSNLATAYEALSTNDITYNIPFALVDAVEDNSPAQEAGFQVGDLILSFGPDIHYANHSQLRAIAHLVPTAASKQETIPVTILRKPTSKESVFTIRILPKPWAGRGLLGCHIIPYHNNPDN